MKSTLRIQVAALALLAPLGAAVAQQVQFGAPVIVAQAQAAHIDRFVVRAEGQILTGSQLQFRVWGTPGGRVLLDVPSVMRNVVVPEVRPGVYEFNHVVRHTEYPDNFRLASVSLDRGGARHTAGAQIVDPREYAVERPVARPAERQAERVVERRPRDTRPPQISDLTPSNGDRVRERRTTEVSARLTDDESGIDRSTVVMRLNGRDVTKRVSFEGNEVSFRDDLDDGRYTAEVVARDKAGNFARRSWTFEVVDRRGHAYGHNHNSR
jgi:hypothetical protein